MFDEQVSELRAARQLVRQLQTEVDESYEGWRLAHHRDLIARHEQAKADMKELDVELRAAVVFHHGETGEKKPHPKLGVRVSEVPAYDEEVAIRFALNTVPDLLKLDTVAFKSYAKGVRASVPLSFVEWEERVTATIARDLGE